MTQSIDELYAQVHPVPPDQQMLFACKQNKEYLIPIKRLLAALKFSAANEEFKDEYSILNTAVLKLCGHRLGRIGGQNEANSNSK